MSRIGRKPIPAVDKVEINIDDNNFVKVKGPKGQLERNFPREVRFAREEGEIVVTRSSDEGKRPCAARAFALAAEQHGCRRERRLHEDARSTGCWLLARKCSGSALQLALGLLAPGRGRRRRKASRSRLRASGIHVSGIDKEQVGQVAANVRKLRPPEPYKGKGIRYLGDQVRRKAGKSGKVGKK